MKIFKNKSLYKFLIPSLIGMLLFVTPVNHGGNLTIPVAVMANLLLDFMGDGSTAVICGLISISAITTLIHRFRGIEFIKNNPKLDNLFGVKGFWFAVRMTGFVFAVMMFSGIGPEIIIGDVTGGVVLYDLMPILVCVFFLAGILLSLLLDYGLLDFFGALLIKIMRPVFNLPGRSALDCVASWLGDGSSAYC